MEYKTYDTHGGNSAHWQHFAALGHDKKLLSTVTSNHRMVSTQTREPNSLGQSPTTAATARDHQVNTEASWSQIAAQFAGP